MRLQFCIWQGIQFAFCQRYVRGSLHTTDLEVNLIMFHTGGTSLTQDAGGLGNNLGLPGRFFIPQPSVMRTNIPELSN